MTRHFWGWRLGVLAAALLLAGTAWGTARAQYPPPTGNVTITSSITAPQVGEAVTITTLVRDVAGAAVGGLACSFKIVSQPGTDASVHPGPVYTDATGTATTTLQVGSTPGPIIIGSTCGELSAQVSVVAGSASVQLPATGTGPADEGSSGLVGLWVLFGASLAATGILVARDLARRVRR
jgi:hypothetical protein